MHPPPPSRALGLAYAQVAIAATLWGTWSLFLRPARVDAMWSSAIMLGAVTLVCAPLLLRASARGPLPGEPPRRASDWWFIVGLAIFDSLNAGLFFAAMSKTTVSVAVLSHYLAPVFVAISAPIALGTVRERRAIPLAFVGLCGLALVLEPWRFAGSTVDSTIGGPLVGAMLGAGSAVFYAANVVLTKRMGGRFTSEEQLVYHSVISAALLAMAALVCGAELPTVRGVVIVAIAGTLVGASAGLLFLYGLRRIPAEHAGMLCFLEPLTAVVIAWLAWGERPGTVAMLGGAVVVASGALAIRTPAAKVPPDKTRDPSASGSRSTAA